MTDYVLPSHAQIADKVSTVADKLDSRARLSGGLKGFFTDGKIQQGDAFMDGTHSLVDHCGPIMNKADQLNLRKLYFAAAAARRKLDASDVAVIQRFRDARKFKHLSKDTYQAAKRASDRALENNLLGPLGGTDPPAEAPPASPEEPDTPHDPGTYSHATLSPGAAGTGGPMDEVRNTSFIYDSDFASSEASIASYKTDRTVSSRKSRYNALPRRKYTDSGHLGVTEGIASLNVDDASVQGGEVPIARPPPGPSLDQCIANGAWEVDSTSHISSEGLAGADD